MRPSVERTEFAVARVCLHWLPYAGRLLQSPAATPDRVRDDEASWSPNENERKIAVDCRPTRIRFFFFTDFSCCPATCPPREYPVGYPTPVNIDLRGHPARPFPPSTVVARVESEGDRGRGPSARQVAWSFAR